jgi:hypothetical protein
VSSIAANQPSVAGKIKASVLIFIGLAGGACGITLLYLGMRSVMDIGGACASGGPFVPVQPCPEGVPVLMIGGIWGGIIFLGVYVWQAFKYHIPNFLGFAWPALFLSLGWNFLDFGLDPPGGGGLEWGWLTCAIVFGLMGGLPLWFVVKPVFRRFFNPSPEPEPVRPIAPSELRARLAGAMKAKVARDGAATATPSTATPASPQAESMVAALERLQYLHRSGSLTDDEFAAAKARIIAGHE